MLNVKKTPIPVVEVEEDASEIEIETGDDESDEAVSDGENVDVVNENSKEEVENKRFKGNFGRLASYKRKDDQMILEKVSIFSRDKIIRLKRVKKGIAYRVEPFAYIPQASHVDNGKRFQDIHFRTRNRFNKLKWKFYSTHIEEAQFTNIADIYNFLEVNSFCDLKKSIHYSPVKFLSEALENQNISELYENIKSLSKDEKNIIKMDVCTETG